MNWTTVENAIHVAVVAGSGLPAAQVIWSQQGGPTPDGQFIALRFTEIDQKGRDFSFYEANVAPAPGEDLTETLFGPRRVTLQMSCFAGGATGSTMPAAVIDRVIAGLQLARTRNALNAAGAGVLAFGPVRSIDGIANFASFEPRAIVEVYLSMVSELTSTVAEIASVTVTNEAATPDTEYTIEKTTSPSP